MHTPLTNAQLSQHILGLFREKLPFNQLIGMDIRIAESGKAEIHLPWQEKLMGNPMQEILHGGVSAAVLDTLGGILTLLACIEDVEEITMAEFTQQLPNVGTTIDLRIDYLRPGKGNSFIATGDVVRKGKKFAVCRMQLCNEKGKEIALGTGTYMAN